MAAKCCEKCEENAVLRERASFMDGMRLVWEWLNGPLRPFQAIFIRGRKSSVIANERYPMPKRLRWVACVPGGAEFAYNPNVRLFLERRMGSDDFVIHDRMLVNELPPGALRVFADLIENPWERERQ